MGLEKLRTVKMSSGEVLPDVICCSALLSSFEKGSQWRWSLHFFQVSMKSFQVLSGWEGVLAGLTGPFIRGSAAGSYQEGSPNGRTVAELVYGKPLVVKITIFTTWDVTTF